MNVKEKNLKRVLLEIGVFGLEENKDKIAECLGKIQKQIDRLSEKEKNSVRAMYYLDNGEKTDEEKIKWLNDNTKSYFYTTLNKTSLGEYKVPRNYVSSLLGKITTFTNAMKGLKSSGIKKQKISLEPKIDEAIVVE